MGRTYTTNFPLTENPISEGGNWINGKTTALIGSDVATYSNAAHGANITASLTQDPVAVVTGSWAANQAAQGTVYSVNQNGSIFQEVELHLRSTLAPNVNSGYEITFRCLKGSSSAYAQIVRWNGPQGSFTYLANQFVTGSQYGVGTGDIVKATAIGNVITGYINGVQVVQATDNTFATGAPGIGFNYNNNTTYQDYGFSSFTAWDLSPIPVGTGWNQIANTHLRDSSPENNFGGTTYGFRSLCLYVTVAWNSAALDSVRNRLYMTGGGHADYYGNEVYCLDLTTLLMTRLTNPGLPLADGTTYLNWPHATPEVLADGTPNARHTYDSMAYMPSIDRMYMGPGGSLSPNGTPLSTYTWLFNPNNNSWLNTNAASTPPANFPTCAYDPNTGKIFYHNQLHLFSYDPVANTYTQLSSSEPNQVDYHLNAEVDPVNKKYIIMGGGQGWWYDISPGSTYVRNAINQSGGTAITGAAYPGMAYDPVVGRIVCWAGGDTVYLYNAATDSWQSQTFANGPGAQLGNGTHGRWAYVPNMDLFVYYGSVDANAFTLRINAPSGDVTPPTVSMTAPANGSVVSGVITVSATASDNLGVAGVQFRLDGSTLQAEDTSAPYSIQWDTSTSAAGTHTLGARARDAAGNTADATPVTVTIPSSDTTAPSVPTGVTATAVSSSQINLTWVASTDNVGVTGYKIFRNAVQITTSSVTSYSDIGLSPSTTYTYTISAFDLAGNNSALSNPATATTQAGAAVLRQFNFTAPGGPTVSGYTNDDGTSLYSAGQGYGWVSIPGTRVRNINPNPLLDSFAFTTGALVTWKLDIANGTYLISLAAGDAANPQGPHRIDVEGVRLVNDQNTLTNQFYTVTDQPITVSDGQLTVVIGGTVGTTCINYIVVKTSGPADITAPSVPAGLSAVAVSASQINLSWTASTDNVGVTGYNIYRNGGFIATSATTSYSNIGLTASTTYTYTVAAFDAAGNTSAQSTSASATTQSAGGDTTAPTVPSGLAASPVSSAQVNLTWLPSSDNVGVTGYKVFRNGAQVASVAVTNYSDTGLSANTTYSYTVSAFDVAGNNSAQSIPVSATTPPIGTGQITTLQLTSTQTGTLPFTVGMVFKKGDVTALPTLDIAEYQATIKRRWNDNSVKHCIFSGQTAFTANVAKTLGVSNSGSNPSGIALTSASIQAAAPTASVQLGAIGTVTLSSLLASPFRTFTSGQEMVECHYRASVDASLSVWFHVRLYKAGRMWIRAIVENGYVGVSVDKPYIPTVIIGGVTVYNNGGNSLTHWANTRWMAEGWIGGDPVVTPKHPSQYLIDSKMFPNYWKRNPSSSALSAYVQTYTPLGNGNMPAGMGTAGFQPMIGLIPNWDALYITSGDPRIWKSVLVNSSYMNSRPIVWRDSATNLEVKPSSNPTALNGYGWGSNSGMNWDFAHHPSEGYTAYLLTGDYWHYETMLMNVGMSFMLLNNIGGRGAGLNCILRGETRGTAWALRSMSHLAATYPTGDAVAAEYQTLLANNVAHWKTIVDQLAGSGTGRVYEYGLGAVGDFGIGVVSPWQQHFWDQSMGMGSDIEPLSDMTVYNAVRNYCYKECVGILGDQNGFYFTYASNYTIQVSGVVSDNPLDWYQNWSQVVTGSQNIGSPPLLPTPLLFDNILKGGSGSAPSEAYDGYWGNLLPAIAYAVDHGATGAAASWARLTGANNFSAPPGNCIEFPAQSFDDFPVWGIVPRGTVPPPPSPPMAPTNLHVVVT